MRVIVLTLAWGFTTACYGNMVREIHALGTECDIGMVRLMAVETTDCMDVMQDAWFVSMCFFTLRLKR